GGVWPREKRTTKISSCGCSSGLGPPEGAQPRPMPQLRLASAFRPGRKRARSVHSAYPGVNTRDRRICVVSERIYGAGLLYAIAAGFEARRLGSLVVRPLGRRLGLIHPAERLGGVETALASGPAMALVAILRLLLFVLAVLGVDEEVSL